MTCIVGIRDRKNKRMFLGADSCVSRGYDIHIMSTPKVFSIGEFLIGSTGHSRFCQIIEAHLKPPPILPDKKLYSYMIEDFIPEMIKTLKTHNWSINKDGREEGSDGSSIVVIRDSLFMICCDYSVLATTEDFISVGCGESYSNGSLFGNTLNKPAVVKALKAASHFSAHVGPPFKVLSRRYE